VYFWMNEDVDAAGVQDFKDGVLVLGTIPTVKRMFVGPAAGTPQRDVTDNSFDYSLILWFDDVAGHDAYQIHPTHTAFVESHGAKFSKVAVYDSVVE
ncbi:MAG: Dabb family protein, partial [Bacteroidota bacterium]